MADIVIHPVFDPNSVYSRCRETDHAVLLLRSFFLGFPQLETSGALAQHNKQYTRPRGLWLKGIDELRHVALKGVEFQETTTELKIRLIAEAPFEECRLLLLAPHHLELLKACTPVGTPDPLWYALGAQSHIVAECRSMRILASLPQLAIGMQQGGKLEMSIPFGDVVDGWPPRAEFVFLFC